MINLVDSHKLDITNHKFCLVDDAAQQPPDTVDCGPYTILPRVVHLFIEQKEIRIKSNFEKPPVKTTKIQKFQPIEC